MQKTDIFYDELKIRVALALKERGIDPVEDRAASIFRSLYYVTIFAACLCSGYAHLRVSFTLCTPISESIAYFEIPSFVLDELGKCFGIFFFCYLWLADGCSRP